MSGYDFKITKFIKQMKEPENESCRDIREHTLRVAKTLSDDRPFEINEETGHGRLEDIERRLDLLVRSGVISESIH